MKTRYEGYTCLKLRLDRGVAFVSIDQLDLERVIAGLAE